MFDEQVLSALATLDGSWQMTCQGLAKSQLTPRERLITTWVLLVGGSAIADSREVGSVHSEDALAMLRQLIRSALESRAPDGDTVWVIPHGPGENNRLAMYLVVAALRRRSIDSRPWLWPAQPTIGRCLRCARLPQYENHGNSPVQSDSTASDCMITRQAS